MQVWKSTRVKPAQLVQLEEEQGTLPDEIRYIWNWFLELKVKGEDLTFLEIKSWSELKLINLKPFEATALRMLDKILHEELK